MHPYLQELQDEHLLLHPDIRYHHWIIQKPFHLQQFFNFIIVIVCWFFYVFKITNGFFVLSIRDMSSFYLFINSSNICIMFSRFLHYYSIFFSKTTSFSTSFPFLLTFTDAVTVTFSHVKISCALLLFYYFKWYSYLFEESIFLLFFLSVFTESSSYTTSATTDDFVSFSATTSAYVASYSFKLYFNSLKVTYLLNIS